MGELASEQTVKRTLNKKNRERTILVSVIGGVTALLIIGAIFLAYNFVKNDLVNQGLITKDDSVIEYYAGTVDEDTLDYIVQGEPSFEHTERDTSDFVSFNEHTGISFLDKIVHPFAWGLDGYQNDNDIPGQEEMSFEEHKQNNRK